MVKRDTTISTLIQPQLREVSRWQQKLVKFILAGFVPLTFFYFFVVFIKINVTSSRLHGVVWFSQALSSPALARLILTAFNHGSSASVLAAKEFLFFLFYLEPRFVLFYYSQHLPQCNHPSSISSGLMCLHFILLSCQLSPLL